MSSARAVPGWIAKATTTIAARALFLSPNFIGFSPPCIAGNQGQSSGGQIAPALLPRRKISGAGARHAPHRRQARGRRSKKTPDQLHFNSPRQRTLGARPIYATPAVNTAFCRRLIILVRL